MAAVRAADLAEGPTERDALRCRAKEAAEAATVAEGCAAELTKGRVERDALQRREGRAAAEGGAHTLADLALSKVDK